MNTDRLNRLKEFCAVKRDQGARLEQGHWWNGTCGCLAGWALFERIFESEGLVPFLLRFSSGPSYAGRCGSDALMEFFDIDKDAAFTLFGGTPKWWDTAIVQIEAVIAAGDKPATRPRDYVSFMEGVRGWINNPSLEHWAQRERTLERVLERVH